MNRPTMEDVAGRANVSRSLVSPVMNNSPQVSDEKRSFQHLRVEGTALVGALLERLSDGSGEPIRHTLKPELVVRGTTGPPSKGSLRPDGPSGPQRT